MRDIIRESDLHENWLRACRGRSFEFTAPPKAISAVLLDAIPPTFLPCSLLATELTKVSKRRYRAKVHVAEIAELPTFCSRGITTYFIMSNQVTPSMTWSDIEFPDIFCSLNGFINLQHNDPPLRGFTHTSSIGIVDRIATRQGDRVIEHAEYRELFFALRKTLRHQFPG